MKTYLIAAAMVIACGFRLLGQEPAVSIKINDEERFRFEDYRLAFTNPLNNIFIGDSAGSIGSEAHDNISIGKFAGSHPGKSYDNIFIGRFAGMSDTSGFNNVYIGYRCGLMSRSGVNNIFIGYESGHNNFDGGYNTFLGSLSGRNNTSGSLNTFIGRRAGNNNTTGSENIFIGQAVGFSNTTGSFNTYVGRGSGYENQEGDSNVCIGYFAGYYGSFSNRLYISNSETTDPLIYGEFDNQMLRFNANRIEIKNPLENTIIGDSSGTQVSGNQNVLVGTMAGKSLQGGSINTYIGYQAGLSDISGRGNVFIGMRTGWDNTSGRLNAFVGTNAGFRNTSGNENTYLGTSAGGSNTTGNFNTCLGRRAGISNVNGSGNVFIGAYAGASEMGSNKLYIANSGIPEPLIYGDFAKNKLKFHADTVQVAGMVHVAGEMRSDLQFNINGNPGVTDTVNSVTSIDFAESKLKYRTIIINGGIATYVSPESGWADAVGEYITPCGMISIIGEFSEWAGDQNMIRDPYNPDLWSTMVQFTGEDDCHPEPCDSIIKVKFRENASWDVNWGSAGFPSGTGIQGGDSIPVPLDIVYSPTIYHVIFNCKSGSYTFTDLSAYCPDSITDIRDNKKYATVLIGSQCWMAQDLNVGIKIDSTTIPSDDDIIEKYCYRDLESNCTQWGGLYQWNELMDYVTTPGAQGICPDGFHVPTDAEFKILEGNVDSQFGPGSTEWNKTGWRGYDAGYNIRSTEGWDGNGNGSDVFGFHALPGGGLDAVSLTYVGSGLYAYYFTSTAGSISEMSIFRAIWSGNTGNQIYRENNTIADGLSLRCLKD